MWIQKKIEMPVMKRGFHLVTRHIVSELPEIQQMKVGLLHLFVQHTSAALTLNENADPDVRLDLESYFCKAVPENEAYFLHTLEGSDDMPAHIKSVILGCELTIPVADGKLALGIWQGIYLCEHRNHAGRRRVVATLQGEG